MTRAAFARSGLAPRRPTRYTSATMINLAEQVRDVPDFPKPGIVFKDITPLLAHPVAFSQCVSELVAACRDLGAQALAAAEARGFLFAAPMAIQMGLPLIPLRKPGKLPAKTINHAYDLEYGSAELQIHEDAFPAGTRVLLIDDVLATGGTMQAGAELIRKAGGVVAGYVFAIELAFLGGRPKLLDAPVVSLLKYE